MTPLPLSKLIMYCPLYLQCKYVKSEVSVIEIVLSILNVIINYTIAYHPLKFLYVNVM